MKILEITPKPDWLLYVVADDGRVGLLDVSPYLESPVFKKLYDPREFMRIKNRGYYIEWACGADLSADTVEACWHELTTPSEDGHHEAEG